MTVRPSFGEEVVAYSVVGDEPMGSLHSPPYTFCVHVYETDATRCRERLVRGGATNVRVFPIVARRSPCPEPAAVPFVPLDDDDRAGLAVMDNLQRRLKDES